MDVVFVVGMDHHAVNPHISGLRLIILPVLCRAVEVIDLKLLQLIYSSYFSQNLSKLLIESKIDLF